MKQAVKKEYNLFYPSSGKAKKNFQILYKNYKKQVEKALNKLRENPRDFNKKGIEKLKDPIMGEYSIRVTKNHRIFYDVDDRSENVYIVNAGKHDFYNLV